MTDVNHLCDSPIMANTPDKRINVRVVPQLHEKAAKLAAKQGKTLSNAVRQLIMEWVAKDYISR